MSAVKIYKDGKFIPFNLSNLVEVPIGTVDYVAYTELDANQLILDGSLVSRELYKDLWEWVQTKPSMLLTEEEWQSALTANEGLACNCYSTGDGSTTFRLPKESVIILPNPNPSNINKFSTDHTGEEVKPKSITKLPIVYAFGRIVNAGELDFQTVVQKQNDLTLNHQIKLFTDLTQIGLTNGIEQFQDIGKNLPENSQITYQIWEKDNHNHVLYPSIGGIFTMEKALTYCRCLYNNIVPNKQWQMVFDYRDEFYIEPTWELLAKNNKLSMPSNNKIIINLKNQGDSWTAPGDGYIWGMKIGDSGVVNSWLNVWDSTDADTSNYGTLIYCDYGQPYINLCGNLAVRKGQTVYFNWHNDCRVYFYPALNNNMPAYGEEVRIYIKAININGYPVKGANVEITISSGYTENGKTNDDGRYLLSHAGYQKIKNANISSGDIPKVMDVKVSSNEGSDVLTLYNLEELQENKIYDLEIHIV